MARNLATADDVTTRIREGFHHVKRGARRAVDRRTIWVQIVARAGHATKAIAYGIAGAISILFAFHRREIATRQPSVLRAIVREPAGDLLIALLGAGLAIQGLWLFADGIFDFARRGSKPTALASRFGSIFRGGVHVGVAVYVFMVVAGLSKPSGGRAARGITGFFIHVPGGSLGVACVGVGILLYGLSGLVRAFRIDLDAELDVEAMSKLRYDVTTVAARFGLVARGIVFGVIGLYVFLAGLNRNPAEAKGVGGVLATLRDWRFGTELLAAVGAGLIAYGVYQLIRARYLRLEPL